MGGSGLGGLGAAKERIAGMRIDSKVVEPVVKGQGYLENKTFKQWWEEFGQASLAEEEVKKKAYIQALDEYKPWAGRIHPIGINMIAVSSEKVAMIKKKIKKKDGQVSIPEELWTELLEGGVVLVYDDIIEHTSGFESFNDMERAEGSFKNAMIASANLEECEQQIGTIKAALVHLENHATKEGLDQVRKRFEENPLLLAIALSSPAEKEKEKASEGGKNGSD